ncbi:hypothetical protein Tco_0892360 [Tanacetum coccineum]|uniref:Uncharacterized protein n=1 Tax=Tanacetum coccineum TaxID=301880 RepID=A0ABQ5C8W3_9ASTR
MIGEAGVGAHALRASVTDTRSDEEHVPPLVPNRVDYVLDFSSIASRNFCTTIAKKQSDQASKQGLQAGPLGKAPMRHMIWSSSDGAITWVQHQAHKKKNRHNDRMEVLQRAALTTPPNGAGTKATAAVHPHHSNKGPELGTDPLTLEGVATELAPSDFVSQNYETLVALMQEETKKRSSQSLQARLNFGVGSKIGKQVSGTQTANLQNSDTHENNDWRISVHDRLGSRDVHSRLGQRRSSSESPPSSDSECTSRKAPQRENALGTGSDKLPRRRSSDGFEELRKIPLKFYSKGRSVPRPVELAQDWITWVKNIKEGKTKQWGGGKERTAP